MTYVHKGPPISYRRVQLIQFLPQPIPRYSPPPENPLSRFPHTPFNLPSLIPCVPLCFLLYYCCMLVERNIICFARVCVCCPLWSLECLYERVCNSKFLCVQILFSQSALMPVSRWVTHQTIEDPRQGTDNTIIKKSFSFFFSEKDGIPSKLKKNIAKGTTDQD